MEFMIDPLNFTIGACPLAKSGGSKGKEAPNDAPPRRGDVWMP